VAGRGRTHSECILARALEYNLSYPIKSRCILWGKEEEEETKQVLKFLIKNSNKKRK
jgi:hypothetical protein